MKRKDSPARIRRTKSAKKTASPAAGPQQTRLWLMYPPKLITTPIIWQLSRKFKVITNVRQASVTDEIGIVCLELGGERSEIDPFVFRVKIRPDRPDAVEARQAGREKQIRVRASTHLSPAE